MAVGGQRDIAGNFECEQGLGRYLERRIKLATTLPHIAGFVRSLFVFWDGQS
jgi:hypothetical protein